MKARTSPFLTGCLAIFVALSASIPVAFAQDSQQIQNAPEFRQQELDQMLAPIALYPDSLLTQILMASTYPLEVVQAARWSRANPGLVGDQAVRAVEQQNWDPSVQSLVAFPQVLQLLDNNLSWTERLGNAFLSQEAQVWDSVQILRQRADAAGNLVSNDDFRVERDGPVYVIESPRPDVIYVPYYDPLIIYGDWWWPGYAPMRWSPWPGYYARPGYGRGYYWGSGISVGFGFFFGGIDWRQRHVNVINRNSFYYRNVNRGPSPGNGWQHDPIHRRGVPYRNPTLRQQFNRSPGTTTAPDARRDFRGRTPNADPRSEQGDRRSPRPPVQAAPAAQGTANVATPNSRPTTGRETHPVPGDQPGQARVVRPRTEQQPQALEGVGRGQDARNASARGQASSQPRPPVAEVPQRQYPTNNPQSVQRVQPQQQSQPQPQRSAPTPHPQPVQQEQRQQSAPQSNNAPREHERGRGEQQK